MAVVVVTDSVASIPRDLQEQSGIEVVSLWVNDGDRQLADVDIAPDEFYGRLADMAHLPTSSQPSVESLVSVFRAAAERGSDTVGVFISEKMSGTIQTARLAARIVLEDINSARIELVDSCSNSMQEGFAALAAAQAAKAGHALEECVAAAKATIPRTRYLFTPESLEYLRRGGRIGAASALLGGLLQIKPILTVEHCETTTFAKVRTRMKALRAMAEQFKDDVSKYGLDEVVVHYIGERMEAEKFAREYVEPIAGKAVRILPVSPVVGVHVGPAVALVYMTVKPLR